MAEALWSVKVSSEGSAGGYSRLNHPARPNHFCCTRALLSTLSPTLDASRLSLRDHLIYLAASPTWTHSRV